GILGRPARYGMHAGCANDLEAGLGSDRATGPVPSRALVRYRYEGAVCDRPAKGAVMDPADCAHPKLAKLDMDRCPDCGAIPTDMSAYDGRAPDEERTQYEVGCDQAGIDAMNDVLE